MGAGGDVSVVKNSVSIQYSECILAYIYFKYICYEYMCVKVNSLLLHVVGMILSPISTHSSTNLCC